MVTHFVLDKWLIGDLALDVYEMSKEKDNRGRADKLENCAKAWK